MGVFPEFRADPPTRRGAAIKMVAGVAVVLAAYGALLLGGAWVGTVLPILVVAGMVTFGVGLDAVLWSGPRAGSKVPQLLRSLVSALVTLGTFVVIGAAIGFAAALWR